MSLNQAVAALATGGPQALRDAFARYPTLSRMIGVVPALEVVKEELADPTSDRIIEVLILAHEKGGHILSDILRDLAEATTRDVRALEEIATEALEQKINARAVFVLPWVVLLVLTLKPGPFRDFYRSTGGVLVVLAGAALSLFGLWLVSRLSREQVERRVLGAAATVVHRRREGATVTGLDPLVVVAVVASTIALAAAAVVVVPLPRRLAGRVRPYTLGARTSLGRSADVRAVATPHAGRSTLRRLFGPPVEAVAARLGRYLDATAEERLVLKLHHAALLTEIPEERRAQEYRVRQLLAALSGSGVALVLGVAVRLRPSGVAALVLLGFVIGAARWRAALDRAIEDRRERMRIELYTVNQLIAMDVRVGGGVLQAVRRVVDRGHGVLVDELADILRAHESGVGARDAFVAAAQRTPEPFVARTYRLLGAGVEFGSDLAGALLDHAEDIRESRREALKRTATRRRAAMLLPIIAVLAPVMLLFIAAPLPAIVFGVR